MEIVTKFNIGDEIYYMLNNKIDKDIVSNITIIVHGDDSYNIVYNRPSLEEGRVFASKIELINTL